MGTPRNSIKGAEFPQILIISNYIEIMSKSKTFLEAIRAKRDEEENSGSDSDPGSDYDSDPDLDADDLSMDRASDRTDDKPDMAYSDLLECFAIKQHIDSVHLNDVELEEDEELLVNAIKENQSLLVIREIMQQNSKLVDGIVDKIFPEEECPNCSKKEEQ